MSPAATWAAQFANNYAITPNVTYLVANNYEAKLDVYARRNTTGPQPTLIHIHGGGWTGGTKESALSFLMPWFEMGWNVVNVEYRLAKVSLAPAAVDRLIAERVPGALSHWDGITHQHCFALPRYIRLAIDAQTRVSTDANPLIVS